MPSPDLNSIQPAPGSPLVHQALGSEELVVLLRDPAVKWAIGAIIGEFLSRDQTLISSKIEPIVRRLLSEQPQGQP